MQPLLSPWRRALQWLAALFLLLLPFATPGGRPLLRVEWGSGTLYLAGAVVRLDELYLLLLASLLVIFLFLFVTMVFGRVWCGWLCPQTALCDLADFGDRLLGESLPGRLAAHLLYLGLAFLVGANLLWYFMAPSAFFSGLRHLDLGGVATGTLLTVAALVYLDLAFVRRRLCTLICPYGRVQLMAMGRETLTLEFDPSRVKRCLDCRACLRACPTGIDIRRGLQVECINCGRCLDACRRVMGARGEKGLIRYTFGRGKAAVTGRSVAVATIIIILAAVTAVALRARGEASLQVRDAGAPVRLLRGGGAARLFLAYVENRGTAPAMYRLAVRGAASRLVGRDRVEVAPNGRQEVAFFVQLPQVPQVPVPLTVELYAREERVAKAAATFAPPGGER